MKNTFFEHLKKTQSIGIHDVLNSQEFAMQYRVISNMSDICKEMDGLMSFIF